MMALMPLSVRVGPYEYDVVLSDDMKRYLGRTRNNAERINISTQQSPTTMKETLLHEVLHACFYLMNVRDLLSHDDEENVIARMSTALFQVLRDNPGLVEYIRG